MRSLQVCVWSGVRGAGSPLPNVSCRRVVARGGSSLRPVLVLRRPRVLAVETSGSIVFLFFSQPDPVTGYFFCRYRSFYCPLRRGRTPQSPHPPQQKFSMRLRLENKSCKWKKEKSQVIITTTWVVYQGRWVSWAASHRRIRPSCAAERRKSLLMNFFSRLWCDHCNFLFITWQWCNSISYLCPLMQLFFFFFFFFKNIYIFLHFEEQTKCLLAWCRFKDPFKGPWLLCFLSVAGIFNIPSSSNIWFAANFSWNYVFISLWLHSCRKCRKFWKMVPSDVPQGTGGLLSVSFDS